MDNEHFDDFINQDFRQMASNLSKMNPYEFSFIATAMGFFISPLLTLNEQNSLGNFFELLGQVMLTVNAQSITKKQICKRNSSILNGITEYSLEEEIIKIKKELIKLRKDVFNNDKS